MMLFLSVEKKLFDTMRKWPGFRMVRGRHPMAKPQTRPCVIPNPSGLMASSRLSDA